MRARHLWSLLLLGIAFPLAAQDPLFRRLTIRDGLPSNRIYTIAQDDEGFIWFGSDAGAARFDGTHIDRYDVSTGLSDDDVFVLTSDSRGRLWFLTGNGRPCYMDRSGLHSWRTDTALARIAVPSGIRSMHEDRLGNIWFGGLKAELVMLSPEGTVRTRVLADPLTGGFGGHITIGSDPEGRVQVFSNARHVSVDGDRTPWRNDTVEEPNITQALYNGRPMCTTPRRVLVWRNSSWATLLDLADLAVPGSFQQSYALSEDELWVTLLDGGVLWLRRENGHWRPVRDILFQDDLIQNVLRDREGNVWLCTAYGGVILFTERASGTAYFRGERGGHEEFLRAHAASADGGGVWCGTNEGDVYHLGERLELVDLPPNGPVFSRIASIRSSGNTLWTATDRYLFRIKYDAQGRRAMEIRSIPSITLDHKRFAGLKGLAVGPDGRLVGSMYGLLELDPDEGVMDRIQVPGIPDLRIYAPHIDGRGTIWFEEQGRLFSLTDKGLREHTGIALPMGTRITDLASLGDTLVIATSGEGLLFYAGDRVVHRITGSNGLSSGQVQHLFVQGGELFVATQLGADRLCGPWSAPRVHHYTMAIGQQQQNVRDVVADRLFTYVLFADGLCRMPRAEDEHPLPTPTPYFRTVLVNDSAMQDRTIVGIRHHRDRLSVELGAVHYADPERVRMEYRTDTTDQWQHTTSSSLDLSALEPGDHVLQVRAALVDGPWSKPATLTVVMIPSLWARWWARMIMVLAVMALVFVVLRSIAYRRYRRQEERVRQREVVAQERQRIAMDLHDDLGAELSSLLLLTRMERERPAAGGLERIEQLAGTLTDKIKEVIWSTDPGHDSLEATLSFIQRHLTTICTRHGLRSRITIATGLRPLALSAGVRRELYLIAKEAVNNAVKYSGGTTFTFGATVEGGMLELSFTDDGRGGATRGPESGGQGLRNMAGRAASIGATLQVTEERPHGTRITLRLPEKQVRPNG